MDRQNLKPHFDRIENLLGEIKSNVPADRPSVVDFRADLAGLFVVSIVASYESCVKDCLVCLASSKHEEFGEFVVRKYQKLNSRIQISDLHSYSKLFSADVANRFVNSLSRRKERIEFFTGKNLKKEYENLLSWRHDFAHAGVRNTTLEEAHRTHRIALQVMLAFDDALGK